MYLSQSNPPVYAVSTVMDTYGHAISTTITPMPCMPEVFARLQLIQCPEGVMRVEYFTRYNDVLRALRGEAVKHHKLARALIGVIEAITGIT